MNQRERPQIRRLQVCLSRLSDLCPENQGAIERKLIVANCVALVSGWLSVAISAIGSGDHDGADTFLGMSEKEIDVAKSLAQESDARHFRRQSMTNSYPSDPRTCAR